LNYHCNNCEHFWEGDDFTVECPNCKSQDIDIAEANKEPGTTKVDPGTAKVDLEPKTQKWERSEQSSSEGTERRGPQEGGGKSEKKSSKKVILIVGFIIIVIGGIGFYLFSEDDSGATEEVKVSIKESDQKFYLEGSVIEGSKEELLDLSRVKELYRASDSMLFDFDRETGQILFCQRQEGHTSFLLNVETSDTSRIETNSVDLSLFGNEPPEKADCGAVLSTADINVAFKKCQMMVSIRDQERFKSLEVSATGRDGDYRKNKFTWDVSSRSGTSVDVWVRNQGGEPVGYRLNNQKDIPLCVEKELSPKPQKDIKEMKENLAKAATQFGVNPRNRKASRSLQQITMNTLPGEPIFIIDGEQIKGFSKFSSKVSIDFRNNGTTYLLVKQPEMVDKSHWELTYRSK